jgi:hypothetical membrane protein
MGVLALSSLIILPVVVFGLNLEIGFAVPEFLVALWLSIWAFYVSKKLLRF